MSGTNSSLQKCRKNSLNADVFVWMSMGFYVVSFFLPAFKVVGDGKEDFSFGYEAFAVGFLSLFSPEFLGLRAITLWLANPALYLGYIYFLKKQFTRALIAGVIGSLLTTVLFSLILDLILYGAFCWAFSIVLFAVGAAIKVVLHGYSQPWTQI